MDRHGRYEKLVKLPEDSNLTPKLVDFVAKPDPCLSAYTDLQLELLVSSVRLELKYCNLIGKTLMPP